MQELR
jgi:hypothetical protein